MGCRRYRLSLLIFPWPRFVYRPFATDGLYNRLADCSNSLMSSFVIGADKRWNGIHASNCKGDT
jgi:hypothetical protein